MEVTFFCHHFHTTLARQTIATVNYFVLFTDFKLLHIGQIKKTGCRQSLLCYRNKGTYFKSAAVGEQGCFYVGFVIRA